MFSSGSYTILLVIELVFLETQVSAFTIQRIPEASQMPDLAVAETSQLDLRNDLRVKDVEVIDAKNGGVLQRKVPIDTTAKTDDIQNSFSVGDKLGSSMNALVTTEDETKHLPLKGVTEASSEGTGSSFKEAGPRTDEITELNEFSSSNTVDGASNFTEYTTKTHTNGEKTLSDNTSFTKVQDEFTTSESDYQTVSNSAALNKMETKSIAEDSGTGTSEVTTTNLQFQTKTEVNSSYGRETENKTKITDTLKSINFDKTTQYSPQTESGLVLSQTNDSTTSESKNTTEVTNDFKIADFLENYSSSPTVNTLPEMIETKTEHKDIKEHDERTETLAGEESLATATPYWKRYTEIDRKRVSATEDDKLTTTEKEEEMIKSRTAQSSASLEKAFSITSDIPSLESLKNDLLTLASKIPTTRTFSEMVSSSATDALTTETATSAASSKVTSGADKLDVVSSLRAGYLDYSRKAAAAETTVEKDLSTTTSDIGPKTFSTLFEAHDDETTTEKKESGTSQSQLDEDAINEELMKEEMINDKAYSKRYREEHFNIKTSPTAASDDSALLQVSAQSSLETLNEDKLSVKPINVDKVKNSGIYTVSPNYKPLKKIEVLPPKPFVRNPDDNSWRNESLSSLGIVFKAKNSSKPFTQVLRNKTETEWNALPEKYNKDEEPVELRERLEKITEIRKSKKKKIDKFGETVYTDYEESNTSGESATTPKIQGTSSIIVPLKDIIIPSTPMSEIVELTSSTETTTKELGFNEHDEMFALTTEKPKKQSVMESYDNDEEEADYAGLSNIDLKKFTFSTRASDPPYTYPATPASAVKIMRKFHTERKPTIQYFPPREPQKVNVNDYDEDFKRKVNAYIYKDTPKIFHHADLSAAPKYPAQKNIAPVTAHRTTNPNDPARERRPLDLHKNVYLTSPLQVDVQGDGILTQDGDHFNKGSYVIRHLRDFINEASKENDDDRKQPFNPTEVPLLGVTTDELVRAKSMKPPKEYYDYEAQFRKDVLDRFVENFNQNSEKFKVDFPVLYNTSVVHSAPAARGRPQAASSASMKRLYGVDSSQSSGYVARPCDPNCERTVELSPAYELHYYVPEEEEKQEMEQKQVTMGYLYRL